MAALIGFAFSDDIKSGNGPGNCRCRCARCRIVAKTLSLISTVCHAAGTRPAASSTCSTTRVLPSFILLCHRRVVVRDLEPRLGKKQPVVGNFSSPVCHSVRPSIFNAVREQSDRSAISRVISESHYILGVSPDCMQSARTMIAKCIPPVNQSVSTHLAAA